MLRTLFLAALAAMLMSAAVMCAAAIVSDLAMSRPRAQMDGWERGESIGQHAARQAMLDRMAMAIAASPLDAGNYLELGRFYAWHASAHPPGSDRHQLFSRRALAAFGQAMWHRPTWGYAWARAAEQRAELDLERSQTAAMLIHASELAPMEPVTQLKILWVGLALWDTLDDGQRAVLESALARLLADPAYVMAAARIARHHGRWSLVERSGVVPENDPRLRRLAGGG